MDDESFVRALSEHFGAREAPTVRDRVPELLSVFVRKIFDHNGEGVHIPLNLLAAGRRMSAEVSAPIVMRTSQLVGLFCAATAAAAATYDAPVVLTVAGSDSGGGAGIQADLKTCEAVGAFGTTAIVALTAQNTQGVQGVEAVAAPFVTAQIDSVLGDIGAHAIKTGMLPSVEIIETVAAALDAHQATVRVIDPVFVAASGHVLVSPDAIGAIKTILLPTATVLTPNMPEAGALLDVPAPTTVAEMREAAAKLVGLGAQAVLLKGGRLAEGDMVDVYADMKDGDGRAVTRPRIVELRCARVDTPNTHGAPSTAVHGLPPTFHRPSTDLPPTFHRPSTDLPPTLHGPPSGTRGSTRRTRTERAARWRRLSRRSSRSKCTAARPSTRSLPSRPPASTCAASSRYRRACASAVAR